MGFPTLVLCLGYDLCVFLFSMTSFVIFLSQKNREDLGRFGIFSVNSTHFAIFFWEIFVKFSVSKIWKNKNKNSCYDVSFMMCSVVMFNVVRV
jgi:hypothetical protein